jgi:hypothetical protein
MSSSLDDMPESGLQMKNKDGTVYTIMLPSYTTTATVADAKVTETFTMPPAGQRGRLPTWNLVNGSKVKIAIGVTRSLEDAIAAPRPFYISEHVWKCRLQNLEMRRRTLRFLEKEAVEAKEGVTQ